MCFMSSLFASLQISVVVSRCSPFPETSLKGPVTCRVGRSFSLFVGETQAGVTGTEQ